MVTTSRSRVGKADRPGGEAETALSRLGRNQQARRQRVITAAMDLAAAGGYDAVQMRDVATAADVALGTIYRYFSSKDHILAEVMVDVSQEVERSVRRRPPRGPTAVDRMLDVFFRPSALEGKHLLVAAIVRALSTADPAVAASTQEIVRCMQSNMTLAMGDDVDPATRDGILRIMGHVWYSSLIGWVNEWPGVSSVRDELATAIRLLLAPRPGAAPVAPSPP